MTDFLSLISAIPSLISNFGGSANPYDKEREQIAGQQRSIYDALSQGPGNAMYNNIYGQYKQQNQNHFADLISQLQAQNRMNVASGRTPLLSPERGSENIFRNLVQNNQEAGVQADQQTRASLGQAVGAGNDAMSGYQSLMKGKNLATAQNLQGYQDIYSLLNGLNKPSAGSMGSGNYSMSGAMNGVNGMNGAQRNFYGFAY